MVLESESVESESVESDSRTKDLLQLFPIYRNLQDIEIGLVCKLYITDYI